MSVIAAATARQAVNTAVVVNAGAEQMRARALADGGVRTGWTAFADGAINDLGRQWACRSGEDLLIVRVRPETVRVDINVADADVLAALFEAAGADRARAVGIADAVIAYRASDATLQQVEETTGDEPEAPRLRGDAFTPGHFASIEELGYLPGMDADLFRAVADDVTVFSSSPEIDIRHASPLIKRALAGLSQGEGSIIEQDTTALPAFEGSVMDVRSIAVLQSGAVYVRQAVVEGPFDLDGAPTLLRLVQGRLLPDEVLPDGAGAPSCDAGFAAL